MHEAQAGQHYIVAYKSGEYIVEFMEKSMNSPRAVVKIISVVEHPEQGDLHNPYMVEVPLFHQRKAAANGECILVPLSALRPYEGEAPDYASSLASAWRRKHRELSERNDEWARRCLQEMELLREEYGVEPFSAE